MVQDLGNSRRVHACFLGHVGEDCVADIFHVLGQMMKVKVSGKGSYPTHII